MGAFVESILRMHVLGSALVFIFNQLAASDGSSILSINSESGDCDLEIAYLNTRLFCHTNDRPAFSMGKGVFEAVDHLGNFDINDTILEKVDLRDRALNPTGVVFQNLEAGIGFDLQIRENEEEGLFEFSFVFPEEFYPAVVGYNRFWANVVGEESEGIFGGGEQYTYLNLKGRNYPIWVREQGVGRNKSSEVTQVMDELYGGGGDYHTTYWPQASYMSSRK